MADFGFCGPAYVAPSIYQNAQECINWRLEKDLTKADGERGQWSLYPTPGKVTMVTPAAAEVRALRSCMGGTILLAVVGNTVYSINQAWTATSVGTLSTSTGQCRIADNGSGAGGAIITDGVSRYGYKFSGTWQGALTDGGFTNTGIGCDCVDNFIVYFQTASQNWGCTNANDTASIALSVAKKTGSPDNIVGIIVHQHEVFLLGEFTTEAWVDEGAYPFPFGLVPIPGTSSQHGCVAPGSVAQLGDSFAWVGRDRKGQGIIFQMQQYEPVQISTHAVTATLQNVDGTPATLSDAVGFTYFLEGHECYVVTFPTLDITWVYDLATEQWHKWLSWDGTSWHRNRANCGAQFNGLSLVGDQSNGKISALTNYTFTEDGNTIRRLRRAPHNVADFKQVGHQKLQLQFQPGVGLSTGQGSDPQAMLRWSHDGGSTWSNEHWRSIGKTGKYRNRAIWRKLGIARDNVYEVSMTDPVKAVIVSADLVALAGDT